MKELMSPAENFNWANFRMDFLFYFPKVAAPAKAGAVAPIDVKIPPQNTGLGPEKTAFFQALRIPTKIARGTIEILVREEGEGRETVSVV